MRKIKIRFLRLNSATNYLVIISHPGFVSSLHFCFFSITSLNPLSSSKHEDNLLTVNLILCCRYIILKKVNHTKTLQASCRKLQNQVSVQHIKFMKYWKDLDMSALSNKTTMKNQLTCSNCSQLKMQLLLYT